MNKERQYSVSSYVEGSCLNPLQQVSNSFLPLQILTHTSRPIYLMTEKYYCYKKKKKIDPKDKKVRMYCFTYLSIYQRSIQVT